MRARHNTRLRNRKLDIHFSTHKELEKDMNQGTLVFSNVDTTVSDDELLELFSAYGEIKEAPNRKFQRSIEYYDVRHAQTALKALNRREIGGKCIKLELSGPGGSHRVSVPSASQGPERQGSLLEKYHHHVGSTPSSVPFNWFTRSPETSSLIPLEFGDVGKAKLDVSQQENYYEQDFTGYGISSLPIVAPDRRRVLQGRYDIDLDRIATGDDIRTTLIIKNIPKKYTHQMLMAEINEFHKGDYDLLWLPIDFKSNCNIGHAFVNMVSPLHIVPFQQTFNGKIYEKFNSGGKVSSLAYAKIQGKSVLAAYMQNLSCTVDKEQFLSEDFLHYDVGQDSDDQFGI